MNLLDCGTSQEDTVKCRWNFCMCQKVCKW